ncbi:MAG TPA: hypothetical protein VFV66_20525 [Nonomuraea sp.]|nr:hypothetical protein [Nonomuraea sp.]
MTKSLADNGTPVLAVIGRRVRNYGLKVLREWHTTLSQHPADVPVEATVFSGRVSRSRA